MFNTHYSQGQSVVKYARQLRATPASYTATERPSEGCPDAGAGAGASSTLRPTAAPGLFSFASQSSREQCGGAGLQRHFCCKSRHKIHGKHLKPDLAQSQLLTDAIVPPPRSLQGSEGTEKYPLPRGMRGEARGAVGGRAEGARPCLRWSERLLDLNNTEDETDCDQQGSEGSRGRLL